MPENNSDIREYVDLIIRKPLYQNIDEEIALRSVDNPVIVEKSPINFLGNNDSRRLIYTYLNPDRGNLKVC